MVYKRYIKRGGKVFGPYYYKSKRDKQGIARTYYVSKEEKSFLGRAVTDKKIVLSVLFLLGAIVILGVAFFTLNQGSITGRAIDNAGEEISVGSEIAEGENAPPEDFVEVGEEKIEVVSEEVGGASITSDVTRQIDSAILNENVKFERKILVSGVGEITIYIPVEATNVKIKEIRTEEPEVEIEEKEIPEEKEEIEPEEPVNETEEITEQEKEVPEEAEEKAEEEEVPEEAPVEEVVEKEVIDEEDVGEEIDEEGGEVSESVGEVDEGGDAISDSEAGESGDSGGGGESNGEGEESPALAPPIKKPIFFDWLRNAIKAFISFMLPDTQILLGPLIERGQEVIFDVNPGTEGFTITYLMPGPSSEEETIERGRKVIINGPSGVEYIDISVYSEGWTIEDPALLKVTFESINEEVPVKVVDSNGDGILDRVEWSFNKLKGSKAFIIIIPGEEEITNVTIEPNLTIVNESVINVTVNESFVTSVTLTQGQAVIGKPVPWVEIINVNGSGNITVEIPVSAENIIIDKVEKDKGKDEEEGEEDEEIEVKGETKKIEKEIDESVSNNTDEQGPMFSPRISVRGKIVLPVVEKEFDLIKWIRKIFGFSEVLLSPEQNDSIQEIEIEVNKTTSEVVIGYETPAPEATEKNIKDGKQVVVSSPEDAPPYNNVLAYTDLPEELGVKDPREVKIYHVEGDVYVPIRNVLDKNGDGLFDYVEWTVPHLSNQTFNIIIILKAEHLDENRTFVSDIYPWVKELDGNWSEVIPDGHYVRATFELELDNTKDITLYPRTVNGTPRIEVYEVGGTDLVAEFASLNDNKSNTVFLTNLNGSQDVFDLRIVDGDVEIDYIVDPLSIPYTILNSPFPDEKFFLGASNIILNTTVIDDDGDTIDVKIYGVNASTGEFYKNGLLYQEFGVANGSDVTYNWIAPVVIPDSDTLFLYHFDNRSEYGENQTYVADFSGNENNGTLINLTGPNMGINITGGKFAGASMHNATRDSYIAIPYNEGTDVLKSQNGFSFFAWVYLNNVPSVAGERMALFSQRGGESGGTGKTWIRFYTDDSINTRLGGRFKDLTPANTVVANEWMHIGFVYNGSDFLGYFNGENVKISEPNGSLDKGETGEYHLGASKNGGSPLDGRVDELVIINRTLSPEEVRNIYRLRKGKYFWKVNVTESYGGNNESETRNFSVIQKPVPLIDFTYPTPDNGSSQTNIDIFVNLSTNDSSHHYSFVDFNNDLVLWMRMDDLNSSNDPTDLSSYSNNGTKKGDAAQTTPGYFGKGFGFDGSDDYIDVGNNSNLNLIGPLTISAWIYPLDFGEGGRAHIVDKGNDTLSGSAGEGGFAFGIGESPPVSGVETLTYVVYNGWVVHSADYDVELNKWQHVAVVWNQSGDGNISFYVNGIKTYSENYTGNQGSYIRGNPRDSSEYPLVIGTRWSTMNRTFNGTIDEVLIFNRSLSTGEIESIYNASAYQYQHNFTGLEDGTHSFTGYAINKAGSKNQTEKRRVFIDNIAPTINFSLPTPANDSIVDWDWIYVNLSTQDDGEHYSFVDFNNDLVLWMRMDDVDANGNPTDLSSYSNNGTKYGNAVQTDSNYFGKGFSFDGDDDYVRVEDDPSLNMAPDFTISAWIYNVGAGTHTNEGIVARAKGGNTGFYLNYRFGEGRVFMQLMNSTDADDFYSISGVIRNNEWYHVAVVVNETTINFFVNGVASGSASHWGYVDANRYLSIGSGWSTGYEFNGTINEVLIFNRSLSLEEIKSLYSASANQYEHKFTSLENKTHTFTGYAVDKAGNKNQTGQRSVTVPPDPYPPIVTINFPENTVYSVDDLPLNFNVSLNEEGGVMYSLDGGVNNITMYNATGGILGTEFNHTNSSIADRSYTFQVYANDTVGNKNHTENVIFSVDTVFPTINFSLPTPSNGSNQTNIDIFVNLSTNDSSHHYSFVDFDNDLVLWMRMDDVDASGNPTDLSSYSNNGTKGGSAVQTDTGYFGKGFEFDGEAGGITVANDPSLNFSSGFTISLWMKSVGEGRDDDQGLAVKGYSFIEGFWFSYKGKKLYFTIYNDVANGAAAFSDGTIEFNEWHHVAVAVNKTGFEFFIDGVSSGTNVHSGYADASYRGLSIASNNLGTWIFNGTLDEVLIFNRSLSTGEIESIYNTSAYQYQHNFTSLANGIHTFTGYVVDKGGNKNQTEERKVTIGLTECGILSETNKVYHVQNDILDISGTCFTITADNITLDGLGYEIIGDGLSGNGVNASKLTNLTIKNLTIMDFDKGIYFSKVNNSLMANNNITSNKLGISLFSSSNNIIQNNIANDNNGVGIRLYQSSTNIIQNNIANDNTGAGFYLLSNSNNNTIQDNTVNSNYNGFSLSSSFNNTVQDNTINNNTDAGFYLFSNSNNNIIQNNTVNSNPRGFSLSSSFNNIIQNNTMDSNNFGIRLSYSSNNIISRGIINNSREDAIYLTNEETTNNTFTNISISNTNASHYDINFSTASINGTRLIDMPYIGNYTFTGAGGTVIFKDSTFGEINFLEPINGTGTNLTNDVRIGDNSVAVDSNSDNYNGLNKSANITLYDIYNINNPEIKRDGEACPASICSNLTALTGAEVKFNVSSWTKYSIGGRANISDCTAIVVPGTYKLTNDIIDSRIPFSDCIDIQANDVVLNCQGYTIDGNKSLNWSASIGRGIKVDRQSQEDTNITIENCKLKDWPNAQIYLYNANNVLLENLNISSNVSGIGVYLDNSDLNIITNNTFSSSGPQRDGIRLASSSDNNITHNVIATEGWYGYGIDLSSSDRNLIRNNTINTSAPVSYGIYLVRSTESKVENNTIYAGASSAIHIEGNDVLYFNHTIGNDNVADDKPINVTNNKESVILEGINYDYGQIIVLNSNNIILRNSNISSNGILFGNVQNSTVDNNNITDITVYFSFTSKSNITNNIFRNGPGSTETTPIYLTLSDFNYISNNSMTGQGVDGSYFVSSDSNTYINNIISVGGTWSDGLILRDGSDLNIINNTIITTDGWGGNGIYIWDSSNNVIYNTTINTTNDNLAYGLYIQGPAYDNIIENSKIETAGTVSSYGIYIDRDKSNTTIYNSIINATSVADINVSDDVAPESFVKLVGSFWDESDAFINDSDFNLYSYHYLDVNVTDVSGALENANVKAWYDNGTLVFDELTAASGFIRRQELLEFKQNRTNRYFKGNYSVNTTKIGYKEDSQSINMSANRQLNIELLEGGAKCGILSEANRLYWLTKNLTTSGTCFNITAVNVTLDCQGHEINYSNTGALGYGVYTNQDFSTIKNCIFKGGNATSSNTHAIYFNTANNGTLKNNTIYIFGTSKGIYSVNSDYNLITQNNIMGGGYGLHLSDSGFNNITANIFNITADWWRASGIRVEDASSTNNLIDKNNITISGNWNVGIYIRSSAGSNTLSNNRIEITNGDNAYGIFLETNNNLVDNNVLIGTNTTAWSSYYSLLYLSSATNITITNNNFTGDSVSALLIHGTTQSHFNHTIDETNIVEELPLRYLFNNNSIYISNKDYSSSYGMLAIAYSNNITLNNITLGNDGLGLFYITNSTITNSTINATKGYGFILFSNSDNNILDNTIIESYGRGALIRYSDNNDLTLNITTETSYGLHMGNSNNNIIKGTVKSYGTGVYLVRGSVNNSFIEMNINSSYLAGFFSEDDNTDSTKIVNSTIINQYTSYPGAAVRLQSSDNAEIIHSKLYGYNALVFRQGSYNNTVIDSEFILLGSGSNYDDIKFEWNGENKSAVELINVSFNHSNINFMTNGELDVKWWLDVNVSDNLGNPIENANITAWMNNGSLMASKLTDANGKARLNLTDYWQNSTVIINYNNYTINTTKIGYKEDSQSINMSANRQLNIELDTLNNPPSTTLNAPGNYANLITRTPTFKWTTTDLEGDTISNTEINITCYDEFGGSCDDNRSIDLEDQENYTLKQGEELQYLIDDGYYYNWSVRASDGEWGPWADERRFNIQSFVEINLKNTPVNFGTIDPGETNDTTDDSPLPFSLENAGNVFVNVTVNASDLWNTEPNPSEFYQFKIDNYTGEEGAFKWTASQTTFYNMPKDDDLFLAIVELNYTNATDTCEIDINITAPLEEGSGSRDSFITFTATRAN